MIKAINILLVLAATVTAAQAQQTAGLKVEASLEFTEYIVYEAIPLTVTISNPGSSAFIIDDYGAYTQNWVTVYVRDRRGNLILPPKDKKFVDTLSIKSGESQTVTIRVNDFYNMEDQGRYQISVVVNRGEAQASSRLISISVVSGIKVGSATRVKEGYDNVTLEHTLLYWARGGKEHLFLRVIEQPSGNLFGFAHLGNIVRIAQPKIEFGPNNTAIVTHQTSRDKFLHTTVDFSKDSPVGDQQNMVSADAVREEIVTRHVTRQIGEKANEQPEQRGFFSKRTRRVKAGGDTKKE